MFNIIFKWLFVSTLGLFLIEVHAQQRGSLGHLANSLRASTEGAAAIVHTICLVVGVGMIMVALFKFKDRYHNPDEVPLRSPVLILLLALAFIALAFLPMPKL